MGFGVRGWGRGSEDGVGGPRTGSGVRGRGRGSEDRGGGSEDGVGGPRTGSGVQGRGRGSRSPLWAPTCCSCCWLTCGSRRGPPSSPPASSSPRGPSRSRPRRSRMRGSPRRMWHRMASMDSAMRPPYTFSGRRFHSCLMQVKAACNGGGGSVWGGLWGSPNPRGPQRPLRVPPVVLNVPSMSPPNPP